jgi:hypothetical protein
MPLAPAGGRERSFSVRDVSHDRVDYTRQSGDNVAGYPTHTSGLHDVGLGQDRYRR